MCPNIIIIKEKVRKKDLEHFDDNSTLVKKNDFFLGFLAFSLAIPELPNKGISNRLPGNSDMSKSSTIVIFKVF